MPTQKKPPLKKLSPSQQQTDNSTTQLDDDQEPFDSVASMGENAAPDNPDHLMPGSYGTYPQSVGDPKKDLDGDDLSDEELAARGYPDPEVTPDSSLASMRDNGTMQEQLDHRTQIAHQMLDQKLDSISEAERANKRVYAEADDGTVDFQNLPNAPKGDVIILGPDEPLRVSGKEEGSFIRLDKAVYRARQPLRTKRWSFTLVYSVNALVPMAKSRKLQEPKGTEPSSTEETKLAKKAEPGTEPPMNAPGAADPETK